MNELLWYLLGYEWVLVTGGSPQWMINGLTQARVPFWSLQRHTELQISFCIFRRDLEQVRRLAQASMCQVEQHQHRGFLRTWGGILRRPVLLTAVLAACCVVLVLPRFLWFFEVEGNDAVPAAKILRNLEDLGVGLGTYGPDVKPKWIKDHMLQRIPELQWITVTQNGCVAHVVVRERPETPETIDRHLCAHVVAARPGLITSQSILAGQAVHGPGDVVLEGELLVSGLVDLETKYLAEHAQAEVFARTWKNVTVKTPAFCRYKGQIGERHRSFWLEIGHHRIKIFGNSGISHGACDKMISRKILSLPGKHALPVAWVVETTRTYLPQRQELPPLWNQGMLEHYVQQRTLAEMQAGTILKMDLCLTRENGADSLSGILECQENIARTVEAKWNEEDTKHD